MKTVWRNPVILLFGIGISNIGGWIYHIALNLIILDRTGSALAVIGLYLLKPLAILFTNGWSGTLIDRMNKRRLMIGLTIFEATLITCLPFIQSIWILYGFVFVINMASSVFHPTSMTYITKLIPVNERKRFNSIRSLVDSGAFVIGPAVAGLLFMIGTPTDAIFINAAAVLLAGFLFFLLPDVEKEWITRVTSTPLSLATLKEDWRVVYHFSRRSRYVILIYSLFSAVTVMTWGVDSLEAAFAIEVLLLTNTEYGFLVSVAGAGILIGAIINALVVKKVSDSWLIGIGATILACGYLVFTFSSSFTIASIGCFVLSFSLAFMNTGFYTFYQNNIPVDVMGRIGSLYSFVEALFTILVMVACGVLAELISIRFSVVSGSVLMLFFAIGLLICANSPFKMKAIQMERVKES
ncbi:MFS transporter [Pseudalkalibacillus hwajinpoensis]|uniref:MFS transporter n=1 Tax=Guptibacillus hwajinpoensis TaxID=208199 RepID=A0A4U1MP06_9BACL|nr:MFS transporter [Pseudalkalibacillus hwajinpoensis]TKD72392.1 MFS transporter [Pseudalkalibacillus hwajinpoensis]